MTALSADLDTLHALKERLPIPYTFAQIRDALSDRQPVDAAWRVLCRAFTDGPIADHRARVLVDVAALTLGANGEHGRRALEELALGGDVHPGAYPQLIPLLKTVTDDDGELFFDVLLDALSDEDPGRAERALYLLRAGYGVRFRFSVRPEQVAQLNAAVATLKALGSEHAGLNSALQGYIPPSPR